jgi:rRNA maturation endonuclease Nob1
MTVPISNWLEYAIDATFHCQKCFTSSVVRIEDLAAKFGPDTLVKDLEPKAICQRCGHRGAEIRANVRANHKASRSATY